MDVVALV